MERGSKETAELLKGELLAPFWLIYSCTMRLMPG